MVLGSQQLAADDSMVQLSLAVVCSFRNVWLMDLSAAAKVAPAESPGGDESGDGWSGGDGRGDGIGGGSDGTGGGGDGASPDGAGDGGGGDSCGRLSEGGKLGEVNSGTSGHLPRSAHCTSLTSPHSLLAVHQAPAWQARPLGQSALLAHAWHTTVPAATLAHKVEHQPIGLATGVQGTPESGGGDGCGVSITGGGEGEGEAVTVLVGGGEGEGDVVMTGGGKGEGEGVMVGGGGGEGDAVMVGGGAGR